MDNSKGDEPNPVRRTRLGIRARHNDRDCLRHIRYKLTCDEFEQLLRLADSKCMLCGNPPHPGLPLNVDHDHTLGWWAVRGLVCDRCNQHLRRADAGEYIINIRMRRYLDRAWHLSQESSEAKAAKVKPRADCPTCGKNLTVNKDGSLARHEALLRRGKGWWSGVCPGTNGAPATREIRIKKGSNVVPFQAARRRKA